jgi:hypothetical protein
MTARSPRPIRHAQRRQSASPLCRTLTLAAAAAGAVTLAACNRVLGPTQVDANWHVFDSAHFSLHARPGTFAEQSAPTLGQVLDDQYETTLRLLNVSYDGRVNGFLYNDAADAGLDGEHSGTAYPDTSAFSATATPPLDANLFALVAHEANHVVIVNGLGRAGTHFLNEGLASALISERYHPLGPHFYYQWTKQHRSELLPLTTLVDDDKWPQVNQNKAYSESASFLAYLLETAGTAKLRQLFYARTGEFAARFQAICGQPLTDAESQWLAFCDAQGVRQPAE